MYGYVARLLGRVDSVPLIKVFPLLSADYLNFRINKYNTKNNLIFKDITCLQLTNWFANHA